MKIEAQVEHLVREVLDAMVKAEPERVQRNLAAFPDEQAHAEGYRLAAAIALYVLEDQYGRQPTAPEIQAVANKLVRSYLSTAAKHGMHFFDALVMLANGQPWMPAAA